MSTLKRLKFEPWTVPIALLVLCSIGYGILAPFLGLYQDDRYQAWFLKAFGPRVFLPFFAHERPLFGATVVLTSSILGWSPLVWQIFALLTRWLSATALWWALKQVWPRRLELVTWTAFLFAVYPGFQQHYVAMIYGHFYLYLAALLFSFGLSVRSIRSPKHTHLYTLAGLVAAFVGLVPIEFFFGMELIRPLLLWFGLEEKDGWKRRLRAVLEAWLPYFLLWAGFLYWRIFVFKFQTYQPQLLNQLKEQPIRTITGLIQTILWDGIEAVFLVWDQTWHPLTQGVGISSGVWLSVALAAAVSIGVSQYLYRFHPDDLHQDEIWHRAALWIGGLSLLWVGIPFWFVGLQVELTVPYDRVTLAFMFSASLIWVGLVEWLIRLRVQKIILISVAIGLAVGLQMRLANSYRLIYEEQKSRFAQLVWRVPALEPQTMILSNPTNSFGDGDNSATAILNWLYDRQPVYPELRYVWLYIPDRIGTTLSSLQPDQTIQKPFRSLLFEGSTNNALVVYTSTPNCLRILDPKIDGAFQEYPVDIQKAIPLVNLDRIKFETDPRLRQEYVELFGPLVDSGWCYYYQKADLARQMGDWAEAARLGDLALQLPEDEQGTKELLVYIESYVQLNEWEKAYLLSRRVYREKPVLTELLCSVWDQAGQNYGTNSAETKTIRNFLEDLRCIQNP